MKNSIDTPIDDGLWFIADKQNQDWIMDKIKLHLRSIFRAKKSLTHENHFETIRCFENCWS